MKEKELERLTNLKKVEEELYNEKGLKAIAGIDEAGRGPLAGPVVVACALMPKTSMIEGVNDSKKISEKKREQLYEQITSEAISYGIGIIDQKEIDEINIYEASKKSMMLAIESCNHKIDHVLIDAMKLDLDIPSTSIIKGDIKSISISAASVIAKVTRDKMMYELDNKYPMYGFANHKGYPTKKHIEAIHKYGLIDGYRKTYGPVKDYINSI